MSAGDAEVRRQALDPTRSFIVQAPAGSGKTGLLTQRYLKLLARVSSPEEILALTFTKKAAGEMRDRILEALALAHHHPRPESEHEALSWDLAAAALSRDAELGWKLQENPQRLQVVTIDSLCARLGHALPILSQFGASPQPVDDARLFYQEAARKTLAHLEQPDSPYQAAIARLLLHLDNDLQTVQQQIADLLEHRDRWLRPLGNLLSQAHWDELDVAGRDLLESALQRAVQEELAELQRVFPTETLTHLTNLLNGLSRRLDGDGPSHLECWQTMLARLPGNTPQDMDLWRSLHSLLLSQKGEWRKAITKKEGFYSDRDTKNPEEKLQRRADKEQIKALLSDLDLAGDELRQRLFEVAVLPPTRYQESQWQTLRALLELSALAAAELLLVFKSWAKADFVEIAQRAERALGSDDEPTEIAMALDAQLRHILVDEFQDTSLGQLRLLERLTAEWTPYEGRTLFLVGDPMQSIYRFRDAEVGLFLRIRERGLPNLQPEALELRANFRSQAGLVEWFNQVFVQVFPHFEDPTTGSVPYSWAEAARSAQAEQPVCLHPVMVERGPESTLAAKQREADRVIAILEQIRAVDPQRRVAILARSRSHLDTILPTLRRRGFRYQGVDLEPLQSRPVVRDLLALTRALIHPADRVAWLAVARAPWCGLTRSELLALADDEGQQTIAQRLAQFDLLAPQMSPESELRLRHLHRVLEQAAKQRQRVPLRRWVEGVWLELGGPATLDSPSDLEDAEAFFRLLDRMGAEQSRPNLALLEERIAKLYAQPDVQADGTLQVMTIHKSKGLQFDTVILPGLSQPPPARKPPLLSWLERVRGDGGSDLLLAPISQKGDRERDPVYKYLNSLEDKKQSNEMARLLYVAATRAERQLHLVMRVEANAKGEADLALKEPTKGSFLNLLWPALAEELESQWLSQQPSPWTQDDPFDLEQPLPESPPSATPATAPEEAPPAPTILRRLPDLWVPPPTPSSLSVRLQRAPEVEDAERPQFEWAGETARRVGSVVHRVLQQVGRQGLQRWPESRWENLAPYLESRLRTAGIPEADLEAAVRKAQLALSQTLRDPRGQWLLSEEHRFARAEYAVSGLVKGRVVRAVVDRTFVDEHGVRWVVDFKTGHHQGGDLETFLDSEQERYRPQLERYAALLQASDPRPIQLGLYFPLLRAWRDWSYGALS